jgi:hypothetical protein
MSELLGASKETSKQISVYFKSRPSDSSSLVRTLLKMDATGACGFLQTQLTLVHLTLVYGD